MMMMIDAYLSINWFRLFPLEDGDKKSEDDANTVKVIPTIEEDCIERLQSIFPTEKPSEKLID